MAVYASGVFDPNTSLVPVQRVTIDSGGATRAYHFTVLRRMEIVELQTHTTAADATDKVTVSLTNVTTSDTIITGTVNDGANEIQRTTSVDSGKSNILLPGHTYSMTFTFAGTAGNVKGITGVLWAKVATHE